MEFVVEGDRTVIRPARLAENPFEKYAGVVGTFPGGKAEINRWLADLRSEDSEAQSSSLTRMRYLKPIGYSRSMRATTAKTSPSCD